MKFLTKTHSEERQKQEKRCSIFAIYFYTQKNLLIHSFQPRIIKISKLDFLENEEFSSLFALSTYLSLSSFRAIQYKLCMFRRISISRKCINVECLATKPRGLTFLGRVVHAIRGLRNKHRLLDRCETDVFFGRVRETKYAVRICNSSIDNVVESSPRIGLILEAFATYTAA